MPRYRSEDAFERYRRRVVETRRNSQWKQATLRAIQDRLIPKEVECLRKKAA